MNNNPLVSMIIPIYNVSEYIESSVKSAFSQSYGNIEFIFVDDCGSDDSMKKLESLCATTTRNYKIVRHLKNCGLSVARNTGIHNANGKYLYFMDSDDTISEECIKLLVEKIELSGSCFVDCNIKIVGGKQKLFSYYLNTEIYGPDKILESFFQNRIHISAWNKLVNTEWLLKNSLFFVEDVVYEDIAWTMKLCKCADSVSTISHVGYNYVIHPGSITRSDCSRGKIMKQLYSVTCTIEEANVWICEKDKKLMSKYRLWVSRWIFRHACRVAAEAENSKTAREFYKSITQHKYKKLCVFPYSLLISLNFYLFSLIFRQPYLLYRRYTAK